MAAAHDASQARENQRHFRPLEATGWLKATPTTRAGSGSGVSWTQRAETSSIGAFSASPARRALFGADFTAITTALSFHHHLREEPVRARHAQKLVRR